MDNVPNANILRQRLGGKRDTVVQSDIETVLRTVGVQLEAATALPAEVGLKGLLAGLFSKDHDAVRNGVAEALVKKGYSVKFIEGVQVMKVDFLAPDDGPYDSK